MDRKKIKRKAFKDLKRQYFKAVLICFLFTVVFGNGYTFVTKIFPNETPKEIVTTVEKDKNNLKNKSRDEIKEDVKIKIEKQSTDINKLIKEIVKPYVELATIQNKQLKLELEYNKKIQAMQKSLKGTIAFKEIQKHFVIALLISIF